MRKYMVGRNFLRPLKAGVIRDASECDLEGADLRSAICAGPTWRA